MRTAPTNPGVTNLSGARGTRSWARRLVCVDHHETAVEIYRYARKSIIVSCERTASSTKGTARQHIQLTYHHVYGKSKGEGGGAKIVCRIPLATDEASIARIITTCPFVPFGGP